jgi:hypothetical protein
VLRDFLDTELDDRDTHSHPPRRFRKPKYSSKYVWADIDGDQHDGASRDCEAHYYVLGTGSHGSNTFSVLMPCQMRHVANSMKMEAPPDIAAIGHSDGMTSAAATDAMTARIAVSPTASP